jgi:hypothetical protein
MPPVAPPVFISVSHPLYRPSSTVSLSSHSLSLSSSSSASSLISSESNEKLSEMSTNLPGQTVISRPPLEVSASLDGSLARHSSSPPDRSNIFLLEPVIYSTPLYGNLYEDSEFFDDRNFLAELSSFSHITEIRLWCREFVHGIQILYEIEEPIIMEGEKEQKSNTIKSIKIPKKKLIETPVYRGSVHTSEYQMKVNHHAGEFVIGIEGTYKEWIESLTIVTNKQKQTFGSVNKNPSYGAKSFICDVPLGHRVVGFQGSFGMHIHNIGVFHQPVSREDLKYRKAKERCVVKKILSYFR